MELSAIKSIWRQVVKLPSACQIKHDAFCAFAPHFKRCMGRVDEGACLLVCGPTFITKADAENRYFLGTVRYFLLLMAHRVDLYNVFIISPTITKLIASTINVNNVPVVNSS